MRKTIPIVVLVFLGLVAAGQASTSTQSESGQDSPSGASVGHILSLLISGTIGFALGIVSWWFKELIQWLRLRYLAIKWIKFEIEANTAYLERVLSDGSKESTIQKIWDAGKSTRFNPADSADMFMKFVSHLSLKGKNQNLVQEVFEFYACLRFMRDYIAQYNDFPIELQKRNHDLLLKLARDYKQRGEALLQSL